MTMRSLRSHRMVATREYHGRVGSPEYQSWRGMIERCSNPKSAQYKNYGAKGIQVCHRWRQSFSAFLQDMGTRPPKHTLGRVKNCQGYSPDNCRWEAAKTQARNKRNNHLLTLQGETRTLAEWAEKTGLHRSAILRRVMSGWSHEAALTTPSGAPKKSTHWLTWQNQTLSITNWAKKLGTSRQVICYWLAKGFSPAETLAMVASRKSVNH